MSYHCHHYNLSNDQNERDALGEAEGCACAPPSPTTRPRAARLGCSRSARSAGRADHPRLGVVRVDGQGQLSLIVSGGAAALARPRSITATRGSRSTARASSSPTGLFRAACVSPPPRPSWRSICPSTLWRWSAQVPGCARRGVRFALTPAHEPRGQAAVDEGGGGPRSAPRGPAMRGSPPPRRGARVISRPAHRFMRWGSRRRAGLVAACTCFGPPTSGYYHSTSTRARPPASIVHGDTYLRSEALMREAGPGLRCSRVRHRAPCLAEMGRAGRPSDGVTTDGSRFFTFDARGLGFPLADLGPPAAQAARDPVYEHLRGPVLPQPLWPGEEAALVLSSRGAALALHVLASP